VLSLSPSLLSPAPALSAGQQARYKDNAGGLRNLFQDLLKASKENRQADLDQLIDLLEFPKYEPWFRAMFGEEIGPEMARDYAGERRSQRQKLKGAVQQAVEYKMTAISVLRFKDACTTEANENQYPALAARLRPEPLYEVRLAAGRTHLPLFFFAHVDGSFRYLGPLTIPTFPFGVSRLRDVKTSVEEPKLAANMGVQAARLIRRVPPDYPERAVRAGLQGTVRLSTIVDREGKVRILRVVKGHCWLALPAIEAVKKWKYSPTLVGGQPVEVSTTIDVIFSRTIQ
jgi:TonB family protein